MDKHNYCMNTQLPVQNIPKVNIYYLTVFNLLCFHNRDSDIQYGEL